MDKRYYLTFYQKGYTDGKHKKSVLNIILGKCKLNHNELSVCTYQHAQNINKDISKCRL